MRALAEAPQMLMKFADLNYEYLMSWDYFDDDWEMVKPTIPFQQLPILIVDDEHQIAQSTSIMRFLQRLAGMEPQDPVVAAKADAILESAQELFRPLNPTVNFAVGEDFESKKESDEIFFQRIRNNETLMFFRTFAFKNIYFRSKFSNPIESRFRVQFREIRLF